MIFLLIILLLTVPSLVFAYLDPGTGTVLINLLIAGIVAMIFSLKSFFLRFIGRGKNTKQISKEIYKIAILSEGKQYWSTFSPIINNLIELKVPFKYYTLDIEDPALQIENDLMQSKFLGYGALANSKASTIKAEILLCTTPNIGNSNFPIKKSPNVKKMIHVFHSISDISMYRKGSLDFYDTIIQVGDFQEKSIREIENKRKLPAKELVSLGLPYLDILIELKQIKPKPSPPKTVLIGSSWGSKGLLSYYGTDFINKIADNGYNIIIRPHPQSQISELGLIKKYKQELSNHNNVIWDETINPSDSMNRADILISDTSSIRFDFAFLYEKPIITLDIKAESMPGFERDDLNSIWADKANHEIGFVLGVKELKDVNKYIENVLTDFNSERIKRFKEKTITNFGQSGKAIAIYLTSKDIME